LVASVVVLCAVSCTSWESAARSASTSAASAADDRGGVPEGYALDGSVIDFPSS
jgi:hypothetical protein